MSQVFDLISFVRQHQFMRQRVFYFFFQLRIKKNETHTMSCRYRYVSWQFHTRWRSIITTMHWLSWTLHLIIFLVFKHQFVSAPIFRADISLTAISDSRNFYFYFLLVWLLCDQLCFGYFSLYPNAYCNRDVLSYYPI